MDHDSVPSIAERLIKLPKDPNTGLVDPEKIAGAVRFEVAIRQVLAERRVQVAVNLDFQPNPT